MKKLIIGLAACTVLVACGPPDADTDPRGTPDRWYTLTDPMNGRKFRCHETISDTADGFAVRVEWCYDPDVRDAP